MDEQRNEGYHEPVLLQACIEGLCIREDGTYVDVTFGGGGHSRAILEKLGPGGRLLVFDQDEDAVKNMPDDGRLIFINHNFRYLKKFLRLNKAIPVDGILADLGVSSYQIDTPERGFSTRFEGALDMRMDRAQPNSAADLVNNLSETELQSVFSLYGEVRNAKQLAVEIVRARQVAPIKTTSELVDILRPLARANPNKYLAQVFQALRIAVNDELAALQDLLEQSYECLAPGGRLVVMSYHSLEDRLVKRYMKYGTFERQPEKDMYGNPLRRFREIIKKPIGAEAEEIGINPRSRSARLRIAEKIEA